MPKRRTREEQTAENRSRVLEAARRVFVRRGFHGASLDEVAEEAGFTKGAVYSRFAGKDDLFLTLLEDHIERRLAEVREATAAAGSPAEAATATARQWMSRTRADRDWALLAIEFRVHAARHPKLRTRYAKLHARLRIGFAEIFEDTCRRTGAELVRPAEDMIRGGLAIGTGLVLERWAEIDELPDELATEIYLALFGALMAKPSRLRSKAS